MLSARKTGGVRTALTAAGIAGAASAGLPATALAAPSAPVAPLPSLAATTVADLWAPALVIVVLIAVTAVVIVVALRERRPPEPELLPPLPDVDPDATEQITRPAIVMAEMVSTIVPLPLASLVVRQPETDDLQVSLVRSETLIGREKSNEVVIDDEEASRRHARVVAEDGAYWVEDMSSLNGTQVNGEFVTRQQLQPGDVIRIGQVTITYLVAGTMAANPTATTAPAPEPLVTAGDPA